MIRVSHLTKLYGSRTAIHDLCFEIKKGEIVGFLGPNGAGKSTTMKIITGFMPPTSGKVVVGNADVFENPLEVKKQIGFLPETPPLYPEMTVEDYLEFVARLHQVPSSSLQKSIQVALEKTILGDVRKRIIGNLSKGYRQRVGLAQALVSNPPVLILDEPTVGLDPKQIIEIRELIRGLQGDHTILLSSHILPEVTATCHRIIVMSRGKIVAEDSLEQLTHRMKKGLTYHLLVKNLHPAAVERLKKIPGVDQVTIQGNQVTLDIQPKLAESRDKIIEIAVEEKVGVLEFSGDKVSLEEIFLELTTEENTGGGNSS